jgi:putative Mg2+ transporter-C (MgtC) family protein
LFVLDTNQIRILLEVGLAMLLGGLIGWDREAAHKPAGLRTHMLISGAAAFLVGLGSVLTETFQGIIGRELIQSDPVRIVEAIIAGISFLGAGTIIRNRGEGEVEGLTTAASLLFAAAVGMGVALSQWVLAVGGTLLVLVTLRFVPIFTRRLPGIKDQPEGKKE